MNIFDKIIRVIPNQLLRHLPMNIFDKIIRVIPNQLLTDGVLMELHAMEIKCQDIKAARKQKRRERKCRRGHRLVSIMGGRDTRCRRCNKYFPYRPKGYLAVDKDTYL